MTIKEPKDSRSRNALILALKKAIEETFDESDWKELGYKTDTHEWITDHHRLLRSLRWGDPDYAGHVFDAIEHILDTDPSNLQILAEVSKIKEWICMNEQAIYSEFFSDGMTIDRIDDVERASDGFDIASYIVRIKGALPHDPELAIGSTKELLESVLKTIIGIHGSELTNDDMPKLLKRTQAALGTDPKDADISIPGGESIRRLVSSLAQIVIAVTELRNLYGTGHGKSRAPGLDEASTNLVVSSGITVASYLMERYRTLKDKRL